MPTANLPTNRTTASTVAEHLTDHNTAHPIINRSQIVIRWNATTSAWEEARPSWAPWGVVFDASNDPAATFPSTIGLLVGDKIELHPASPLLPQNR